MASIADRPILHAAALFAETASKGESATPPRATIGVLAIQGAFLEHITYLRACGAAAREVREPHQFEGLDALVIPGGESTTMAIVAKRRGMWEPLEAWIATGKPTWGTCAGMILLANHSEGSKVGGQALLSSMDVKVHRNYFGSQVGSFEAPVAICEAYQAQLGGNSSLPGVFIRAPAVLAVGKGVEVVATVRAARASAHRAPGITAAAADTLAASGAAMATAGEAAASGTAESVASDVIVAAVKGNHRLVTAFHPELTASRDWHEMFIQMVEAANKETATASS